MKKTKTQTEAKPEQVTVYLAELHPFESKNRPNIGFRSFQYTRSGKTLTEVPLTEKQDLDGERRPPHGLRRIPYNSLPKRGGLFDTAVAALDPNEAVATLLIIAEREAMTIETKLNAFRKGIDELKEKLRATRTP